VNVLCAFLSAYVGLCADLIVEVQAKRPYAPENRSITSARSSRLYPAASAVSSITPQQYSRLVDDVHRRVNEFRRSQGLKPLTLDPRISEQAREHSADMARIGKTITHRGFAERLEDLSKAIPLRAAAENVAAAKGQENPAQTVVEGWTNSTGHLKNILGDFNLTGIGIAQSDDGTYFFTQIFIRSAN
jgi:uncharacterized protein YkwD